jgi:predicted enzyme related to lactoylglutathione lyase
VAARPTHGKDEAMDWKLELIAVPVTDVDRAKRFYTEQVGSIALGTGVTDAQPGSVTGLQIVVDDIDAAHTHLATRGVEVSEVQDFPWGRFVFFKDPDGNSWAVQQIVVPDPG